MKSSPGNSLPDYQPMLATRWPQAFDDDGWWFEVKWDGYRSIISNDGSIRARSRRGIDLAEAFPELLTLPVPAGVILDGEIVAFDENGQPSFDLIQKRTGFGGSPTGSRTPVNFVVFDLLYSGGESRIDRPIEERRSLLADLDLLSQLLLPAR